MFFARPGTGGVCCEKMTGGSTRTDQREKWPPSSFLPQRFSEQMDTPSWDASPGEQGRRLLFEAPPLQPADHKEVAGLCVVASVFSANTALSSVSRPRVMGLPRTQAWLPAAGYLHIELFNCVWSWAISAQGSVAL